MMIEQRLYPRFLIESMDINGRIMFANNVEILDISLGGVLLKTDKRLNIGTVYMLRIEIKGKILSMPGKVVRAELNASHKDSMGQIIPIYSAGMQFTNVSHEQIEAIQDFLKEHIVSSPKQEHAMRQISERRLYVRFLMKTPEQAIIDCYDSYKVNNISIGGILIESCYCLEIGEKLPMEMVFSEERTIKFIGRVITSKKAGEKELTKYDIGIEFHDMSDKDKEVLEMFVDSL